MSKSNTGMVLGKDGLHGTLVKASKQDQAGETYRRLLIEDGRELLVPVSELVLQQDGSYYLPLSLADLESTDKRQALQQTGTREEVVIPLVAEQLAVTKQQVVSGRVRLNKLVREHQETVDEPLLREQVNVERVPINRVVSEAVAVRHEGDTMIIPVLEEVLVVEKRLMLKEELHVTIQRTTVSEPQTVTLRSEEIQVKRIDPSNSDLKQG